MLRGVLSVRLGDGPRGVFEPAPPLFTRVDIAGPVPQAPSCSRKRRGGPALSAQSEINHSSSSPKDDTYLCKVSQFYVAVPPRSRLKGRLRCPLGQQKLQVRNVSPEDQSKCGGRSNWDGELLALCSPCSLRDK